jgi:hypothetical protein
VQNLVIGLPDVLSKYNGNFNDRTSDILTGQSTNHAC